MSKGNQKSTKSDPGSQKPARKPRADVKPKAERPKPKVDETENLAKEPPPTANSKLPTENMEVHHHPQLDHNPKPWKEYLLEGFMIFIAVMMGFIAENIREGIDNRGHARQLTLQLVHDP